ncbi:MAG: ketopantoate reductase family protein [Burkholderiales bacterium]|jgi:ketopantoate reductase
MAGAGSEPGTGAWPDIAVFGAGAVGCHYGAKLALAGAPVTLIGRGPHVAAIRERGLWFDSGGARTVVRLAADTSPDPVATAGLVLLCVKSADTAEAAREIAARLHPGATSSTEQDLARGRPTEIDSLNGYVVARGGALGVPVPMNRALHALVRMLERERAARG